MPLINCPDCQQPISDSAAYCLNCGRPIAQAKTTGGSSQRPQHIIVHKGTSGTTWGCLLLIGAFIIYAIVSSLWKDSEPRVSLKPVKGSKSEKGAEEDALALATFGLRQNGANIISCKIEGDRKKRTLIINYERTTKPSNGSVQLAQQVEISTMCGFLERFNSQLHVERLKFVPHNSKKMPLAEVLVSIREIAAVKTSSDAERLLQSWSITFIAKSDRTFFPETPRK